MEKELEALEILISKTGCMNDTCAHLGNCLKDNKCRYNDDNLMCPDYKMAKTLKDDLTELKAIKEAKPSEALKWLEKSKNIIIEDNGDFITFDCLKVYSVCEQALLKAQEQEKENAYIEKIKTMMKQKDCVLRYIESEDCFAVKTILSDGWYKLTPDFVDNNVREEIKPLPLIEKNKQLKEENAEYKRVLEIIKGKVIWVENGKLMCGRYADTEIELEEDDFEDKKEFNLLKRWLG